ncbi:MAG: 2-oxoglutarate and iron-dependent oxygenase domain-containing protein, partial [Rhizobacter sp.]
MSSLPLIDVAPLRDPRAGDSARGAVARALDSAARTQGFFYVANHRVDPALVARAAQLAREFFAS